MRIGLNLLHAVPGVGGTRNYVAGLLRALGEWGSDMQFVAFAADRTLELIPDERNFEAVRVKVPVERRPARIAFENSFLQMLARREQVSCMHWFSNTQALLNAVPGVVTVYDLMVFTRPGDFSFLRRIYLQAMIARTVHRARLLAPMSESTAAAIRTAFPRATRSIIVVPPVLDRGFTVRPREDLEAFRRRHGLPPDYWVYVAHHYHHKNHTRLLRTCRSLLASGYPLWPLVLCGDPKGRAHALREEIRELRLEDHVIPMSAAPDGGPPLAPGEIPLLYGAASAQVFPSLFEGGGLPVLEALACGCALAASRIRPVVEFAGEAAEYFDPQDEGSMARSMRVLQSDSERRVQLRRLGLERSKRFRGQVAADRLRAAYEAASATSKRHRTA